MVKINVVTKENTWSISHQPGDEASKTTVVKSTTKAYEES